MTSFQRYAEYYDLIYRDKDYEGECRFVEEILRRFVARPVRTILDAGCGTGGHAIPLARRGYTVTGIDISEVMLGRAREKAAAGNVRLELRTGDVRRLDLGVTFDACIGMFAVVGYITGTEEVLESLRCVRRHLEPGGLFVFDVWNGLAVLRTLPSVRVKTIRNEQIRIIRSAEPQLDAYNHLCHVNYHLLVMNHDNTLLDEIAEKHTVRYYFPQELVHYLGESGFEVLGICPFLEIDGRADENAWNITAIAKAI